MSLLVFLGIILLVFGTVNPLGKFWGHWFPVMTPDTRARKEALFEAWNRAAPVEGLIIGSSRSMKLDPKEFSQRSGLRFFNFSVSLGTVEDAYAILDFVMERAAPLRLLVIGVDDETLVHDDLPSELSDDWELAPRVQGRSPTLAWKVGHGARLFKESLTLSDAAQVAASIGVAFHPREPFHKFRSDGYQETLVWDGQIAAGTYDLPARIHSTMEAFLRLMDRTHQFDSERIQYLDRTLKRARKLGIGVIVWMTPYHPDMHQSLATRPELREYLAAAADTVQHIAAANGASFVDLQHEEAFGGDPSNWYDSVHYASANAVRIVARLLSPVPSAARARGL